MHIRGSEYFDRDVFIGVKFGCVGVTSVGLMQQDMLQPDSTACGQHSMFPRGSCCMCLS